MSGRIASASWGASICDRIVLEGGRVVYAHYRMDSYGEPVWRLETVMLDAGEVGSYRQTFDLHPVIEDREPDVLPEWLREVVESVPLSAPRRQAETFARRPETVSPDQLTIPGVPA
jgi:hypothetical protein